MAAFGEHDAFDAAAKAASRSHRAARAFRTRRRVPGSAAQDIRCAGKHVLDVPVAEARREPDVVPAAKRRVDVLMMPGEARTQIARRIALPRLRDADAVESVLDEHVRRQGDDAAQRAAARRRRGSARSTRRRCGRSASDARWRARRAALEAPPVPRRACSRERAQRPVATSFRSLRASTRAAGQSRGRRNPLRKVPPHRHAAQAFMEEYQRRRRVAALRCACTRCAPRRPRRDSGPRSRATLHAQILRAQLGLRRELRR